MSIISKIKRAWFLLIIILIAYIHYKTLMYMPLQYHDTINQIIISSSQVIGGIIVLLNINSNLVFLGEKKLITQIIDYFKSFNPRNKCTDIYGTITAQETETDTASVSGNVRDKILSDKEKIEFALRNIEALRKENQNKYIEFNRKLSIIQNMIIEKEKKSDDNIDKIQDILNKVVIGSIDTQIFGVLLVIYGEIVKFVI